MKQIKRLWLRIVAYCYNEYQLYHDIRNGFVKRLNCFYCYKYYWFYVDPSKEYFTDRICKKCEKKRMKEFIDESLTGFEVNDEMLT